MSPEEIKNKNIDPSDWWAAGETMQLAHARRVEHGTASAYKLRRKASGELVLVGAFAWSEGNAGGIEWREIETEIEPAPEMVKHKPWCASLTKMLLVYPPKMSPCDCEPEKRNGA